MCVVVTELVGVVVDDQSSAAVEARIGEAIKRAAEVEARGRRLWLKIVVAAHGHSLPVVEHCGRNPSL